MNVTDVLETKQRSLLESSNAHEQRGPMVLTGLELYSVVTLLVTLSVSGTVGNILVLSVFRKKRDKLVSTVLIIVLACVDLSTCVLIIPYTVYMESVGFLIHVDAVCKLYQFLITSNIPFSALIMVTIAVDRYLCICHPLIRSNSTTKAKVAVVGLGLCAAGIGVCVSLMYGVHHRFAGSDPPDRSVASEPQDTEDILVELSYTTHDLNETISRDRLRPACSHVDCPRTTSRNRSDGWIEGSVGGDPGRFVGVCAPNDLILGEDFQWYFQKAYNGLYLVCFVTVVVLYTLIYRSVMLRRRRRLREKRKSHSIVASLAKQKNGEGSVVMREMTAADAKGGTLRAPAVRDPSRDPPSTGNGSRTRRKSWSLDSSWIANLKTAAMLFVVTVVFIVTFLPAFMMTLGIIPYNAFVFYLYFANNVANPVIYSFMNQNFRDDLRRIVCLRASRSRSF